MSWRFVGGAVAVAIGLVLVAPDRSAVAAPLLIFVACPLSMMVVMRRARRIASVSESRHASQVEIAQLRSEVEVLRIQPAPKPDGGP